MPEAKLSLNNLKRAQPQQRRKRVGRGNGSGYGTTCGRGYKGQKSRAGGYHKVGFEGGQMPLQRRLPKIGFHSRKGRHSSEVRLHELNLLESDVCDMQTLREARLIPQQAKQVKIILSGKLDKAITVRGVKASRGARSKIEELGGKIE